MGEEAAPQVEGERGIDAGQPGDEVALECVDGFFGRVSAVIVGGGKLVCDAMFCEDGIECLGAFIVAFFPN